MICYVSGTRMLVNHSNVWTIIIFQYDKSVNDYKARLHCSITPRSKAGGRRGLKLINFSLSQTPEVGGRRGLITQIVSAQLPIQRYLVTICPFQSFPLKRPLRVHVVIILVDDPVVSWNQYDCTCRDKYCTLLSPSLHELASISFVEKK